VRDAIASSRDFHPLDRVIWEALNSQHKHLALGDHLARRYPREIAPFAATADETPDSYRSLLPLLSREDRAALFTPDEVTLPPELTVVRRDLVDQMILDTEHLLVEPTLSPVTLSSADLAGMRRLVDLTQPGPFGPRTIELGTYLGVRTDGTLVAMAGERMKLDGYTEISAVCVHPSQRGIGLAAELVGAVARMIVARDEIPILHVFASNAPAIALYRKLGFVIRRRLHLAVAKISN
jgi:ribosomal protein S18 acetylase RimI-like enzyme